MIFMLGTHEPHWLESPRFADVPLFLARQRLAGRKTLPRTVGSWSLDSGGFSELHPEDFPNPGPEDVESWRGTLAESKPSNPCFSIVGRIEVGAWEGDAATGEIRKMQPR